MREDLIWRPLTRGDARTSADLLNAMEAADQVGEFYDERDTLQELVDPYTDLERGSLAAFDGDVMAGFMKTRYQATPDGVHRITMDGGVAPAYRRQGLGTRLLKAGVAAAGELHALHHPALHLAVDIHKPESMAGLAELVRAHGFTQVSYYQHLEHALGDAIPAAPVPTGLRLEPWSAANDEDFRLIRNEAFKTDRLRAPMTAESWTSKITNQSFRPTVSFLLRDEATGAPAGMLVTMSWDADTAATGIRDARFLFVATQEAYRRRGVAAALIGHALRTAAGQGYDRALVEADSQNPFGAINVYEKAGFTPRLRFVSWALEVPHR
ncbi:N-acetyltransferase [Paractinoplanes abujensis]|uniref:Ribosomal protein S18 acetylase RimI-like enzyme n=1 Tax=Paractinoplanes abujensis TaxID=882441 RepID=A0A7W7CNK9_9ACTN|nr:GNAT family N-acetyltransferase [Actinoplanes abujensis]MBB4691860.1 ribosomal protein S18 acetylase RimI-like enzyme [Actinoplanes abujensis]GID16718.1 N-acetyltransferase [Actinoplanes abujensis]